MKTRLSGTKFLSKSHFWQTSVNHTVKNWHDMLNILITNFGIFTLMTRWVYINLSTYNPAVTDHKPVTYQCNPVRPTWCCSTSIRHEQLRLTRDCGYPGESSVPCGPWRFEQPHRSDCWPREAEKKKLQGSQYMCQPLILSWLVFLTMGLSDDIMCNYTQTVREARDEWCRYMWLEWFIISQLIITWNNVSDKADIVADQFVSLLECWVRLVCVVFF